MMPSILLEISINLLVRHITNGLHVHTFRAYTLFISCIAVPTVLIVSVNPNDAGVTQKQPRYLKGLITKKS